MGESQALEAQVKHNGLFTLFGISVNLNTVVTTVAASISWLLISGVYKTVNENVGYIRQIPAIQSDLSVVKAEQVRIRKDYAPPVK